MSQSLIAAPPEAAPDGPDLAGMPAIGTDAWVEWLKAHYGESSHVYRTVREMVSGETTPVAPPRPVRTIADLVGMICGAADACGVETTAITHRSIRLLLPGGAVRVDLRYPDSIPLMDEEDEGEGESEEQDDPFPSDNHPVFPAGHPALDDCGTVVSWLE